MNRTRTYWAIGLFTVMISNHVKWILLFKIFETQLTVTAMFRVQYATHMRSNMQNGSPRWKICSSGQCLKRTLSFVSRHCSACKEAIILQRYHKVAYVKTIPLTDSYLPLRQFRPQNYLRKTIRLPELLKVISLLELLTLRQLRYHRLTYLKIIPLPQIYLR